MTEDDLPDPAKLMSYLLGAAHELKEKNLLAGFVGVKLTPKGIAMFDQLKASGYRPTDDELAHVLTYFCGELDPGVFLLFIAYRDGMVKDGEDSNS